MGACSHCSSANPATTSTTPSSPRRSRRSRGTIEKTIPSILHSSAHIYGTMAFLPAAADLSNLKRPAAGTMAMSADSGRGSPALVGFGDDEISKAADWSWWGRRCPSSMPQPQRYFYYFQKQRQRQGERSGAGPAARRCRGGQRRLSTEAAALRKRPRPPEPARHSSSSSSSWSGCSAPTSKTCRISCSSWPASPATSPSARASCRRTPPGFSGRLRSPFRWAPSRSPGTPFGIARAWRR